MSRKNKITITHTEDFSEIEAELSSAMENLDETNLRIETMLREHAKSDTETENAEPTGTDPDNQPPPETGPASENRSA